MEGEGGIVGGGWKGGIGGVWWGGIGGGWRGGIGGVWWGGIGGGWRGEQKKGKEGDRGGK